MVTEGFNAVFLNPCNHLEVLQITITIIKFDILIMTFSALLTLESYKSVIFLFREVYFYPKWAEFNREYAHMRNATPTTRALFMPLLTYKSWLTKIRIVCGSILFTFSSHTKYVKRESIVIVWVTKKFSPFDECSCFVCLRRQNKQKKDANPLRLSIVLSHHMHRNWIEKSEAGRHWL